MNPLEETQIVTPNDVLAFAEECAAPEVDRKHIEEFLDLQYLSKTGTPISICRIAVEVVQDAMQTTNETARQGSKGNLDENVSNIELEKSCLDEEQKAQFRQMLNENRDALAFSIEELGQCEICTYENYSG